MSSVQERRRCLEQDSIVLRDYQGERVFVEKSKDGWTFLWNDEPGFRVETIDDAVRWLNVLCPPVKVRRAG